ncbi:type II toxin-antitoxin system RelE/ParE family toxin [Methylobacterium aerolatum]|uniref:Toxin ParE1/3/4 n=1 Tax=Methylobacterium aerolatum TaxID=418708 RepID=A0ABU0I435_9HYPH|nr:type II toxin-antitoxin system RelE/ParE family toxin [Methylobacterium aerolatum]MDQ0449371.1 toxin ParE1/3/4 [Methylobacterium aerolatum]GJD36680.1 hypothetical protein FMGBMHLM_3603 [Methylobacterium aerolatum]
MSRILRHPRAVDDLLDLWSYVAQDDVAAADRLLDTIQHKLELIADRPLLGRARPELAQDLHSVVVGNVVLFYRPVADGIVLIRALSRYRDLESIAFDPG